MKIDGQIVTYADDTCLLFSGVTWDEVRIKVVQDLKKSNKLFKSQKTNNQLQKNKFQKFFS